MRQHYLSRAAAAYSGMMGMGLYMIRRGERGRWYACSGERKAMQRTGVAIFKSSTGRLRLQERQSTVIWPEREASMRGK